MQQQQFHRINIPSPAQTALELVCALAASGKLEFKTPTNEGKLVELVHHFIETTKIVQDAIDGK